MPMRIQHVVGVAFSINCEVVAASAGFSVVFDLPVARLVLGVIELFVVDMICLQC